MSTIRYLALISILLLIGIVSASTPFVAQGDSLSIQVDYPNGTFWVFPKDDHTMEMYDIPVRTVGNTTLCTLTNDMTKKMRAGHYTIMYKYPATISNKPTITDISYVNNSLVSKFSGVSPIDLSGKLPSDVMIDLQNIVSINNLDSLTSYTIAVEEPTLRISRMEQINPFTLRIAGENNFADNTQITIRIDENEHYAKHDMANFTFYTNVNRTDLSTTGVWGADMILPLNNMAPGWHDVNVYANEIQASVRFPIYQTWEPVPTPTQYINYFGNGSIKPDVVRVVQTVVKTEYVDKWHTATPTPIMTDILGDKVNYPYRSDVDIPVIIGIISMLAIAAIALFRGYKLK